MDKKSFLEEVGVLFVSIVFIEGIIKDLIIIKKHPEFIESINKWIPSKIFIEKRKEYWKKTFNEKIIKEFIELWLLDKSYFKLFSVLWLIRDCFWHSRICINEKKLDYIPNDTKKLEKFKELFWIIGDGDVITINDEFLNFEEKNKQFASLDGFFRKLSKSIWLDYEKIR